MSPETYCKVKPFLNVAYTNSAYKSFCRALYSASLVYLQNDTESFFRMCTTTVNEGDQPALHHFIDSRPLPNMYKPLLKKMILDLEKYWHKKLDPNNELSLSVLYAHSILVATEYRDIVKNIKLWWDAFGGYNNLTDIQHLILANSNKFGSWDVIDFDYMKNYLQGFIVNDNIIHKYKAERLCPQCDNTHQSQVNWLVDQQKKLLSFIP